MRTQHRARAWLAAAILVLAAGGFGPSGPGAKVTDEQLEYSKQMFAEGEAAMEAGDYATALAKYHEGYRYAPHLHVFTFNIASAADAMDDCRTAYTYFRMFLDLVPEHPQRKTAQKRYDELAETCQFDTETEVVNSAPAKKSQAVSREERAAIRAMNEAFGTLRTAQQLYDASKNRYPDQPFGKAARRKRKDVKKVLKLADKLGVEVKTGEFDTLNVPSTEKETCQVAERVEKRAIAALEEALEYYDTKPAYRILGRALRAAERAAFTFDACAS